MRIFLTIFLFLFCGMPLRAQSLDFARDVFFNHTPLKEFKDFYYQNSPLLSIMQSYGGKGLNVALICSETTPITTAKKNIELELSYTINRPYLSNLNVFNTSDTLRDFLTKNEVDLLIIEENFLKELSDIKEKNKNKIIVFSGESKTFKNPAPLSQVRPWWHYNFKLDAISKELIKVWHGKEKYRNFILFIERSKNFTISSHKRWPVLIMLLILGLMTVFGYYRRISQINNKKLFLCFVAVFFSFLIGVFIFKWNQYHEFVIDVRQYKNIEVKNLNETIAQLDQEESLIKVMALRSLTERVISKREEDQFKNSLELLTQKLKPLIKDEDERVRMWSLTLISKLKDESLINYIAGEAWEKEVSYLVRTRVVRALASLQNQNTDKALLQMKGIEKHPYVYTELREICLERNLWSQGEPIESVH